jgi:chromosome segregation protein
LKTNLQHYEQQITALNTRRAQFIDRHNQLPLETLTAEIEPLVSETTERRQDLAAVQQALTAMGEAIQEQRRQNAEVKQQIDHQYQQLQTLQSRHTALAAMQQSALGYHDDHTQEWLKQHALHERPRLGQVLQVNPGWELAVEAVLGGYFDAVCLDRIDEMVDTMAQITQGHLTLIDVQCGPVTSSSQTVKLPLLSTQVQSSWPLHEWLSGVYAAVDLTAACQARGQLANDESIITQDGTWLGKNWVRINKAVSKDSGILLREQQLKQLSQEVEQVEAAISHRQEHFDQGESNLRLLEEQRETQHRQYQLISTKLTEAQMQLSGKQSRLTELQQQQQRLEREMAECDHSLQNLQDLQAKTRRQFEEQQQGEIDHTGQQMQLQQQREQLQRELAEIRQQTHRQRQAADEFAIRLAATENQLAMLKQSSLRDARQRQQLTERRELLTNNIEENAEPLAELRTELQQQLNSRLHIEQTLREAEEALRSCQQQVTQLTKAQRETQEQLTTAKTQWQNLQLERQALLVRQTTIQEYLSGQNWLLADLVAALPAQANAAEWEKQLETVTARISRLGPINLAAIDEYQVINERKTYLDKQQADLNAALTMLTGAISKIDRETRQKFQETFTQVNQHFQELFPRIFGGGKAVLELLEEDWLTAGVLVKAQPPGKRNATIHMLSGGEKALTAVALVFAMFRLNPAPFCVLDEVDAPLDDMNTGRFCQLVKEMAKTTQFIVISHNKVTISMSERLMGVTMQEAGVSRIVSVNVTEAVALAEA